GGQRRKLLRLLRTRWPRQGRVKTGVATTKGEKPADLPVQAPTSRGFAAPAHDRLWHEVWVSSHLDYDCSSMSSGHTARTLAAVNRRARCFSFDRAKTKKSATIRARFAPKRKYPRKLTDQLEALGFRRLGPEPVGPAHRHRSLWAGPPGFVDVVGRPDDQRCDFRRVRECNEGLTAHKARRLTLCIAVAIQQLSRLVNLINLGPVMRENTDHAAS